jgi:hypothetical protein
MSGQMAAKLIAILAAKGAAVAHTLEQLPLSISPQQCCQSLYQQNTMLVNNVLVIVSDPYSFYGCPDPAFFSDECALHTLLFR